MAFRWTLLVLLAAVLLPVNGCGPKTSPSPGLPQATSTEENPCVAGSPGRLQRDVITVSVSQEMDLRRAPVPGNESELLLYRQVYESLVRVDCRGRLHPALAGRWWRRGNGSVWEFELRDDARFSDGSPALAQDVKNAWISGSRDPEPYLKPLWAWIRPESVLVVGERRLVVRLDRPLGADPLVFAHPALAVAEPAAGGNGPPLGTGPYAIVPPGGADTVRCDSNRFHPEPGVCPLRVLSVPGADPRDLIGGGGDAVVVREREAVNYASEVADLQVIPLPWDRLYLLVSSHFEAEETGKSILPGLRRELANDIAASEAREAVWFAYDAQSPPGCAFTTGSAPVAGASGDPPGAAQVAYWDEDTDSERLASRLVALEDIQDSTATGLPRLRADGTPVGEGESRDRFLASLVKGTQWAYVVALRREFPDRCLDLEMLLDRVPWMRCVAGGCGEAPAPRGIDLDRAAIPLVVTRPNLVCRKALAGVELGWDGIPLFHGAGWTERRTVP